MTPEASDELADPVVWDILLSRIVARPKKRCVRRKKPTDITATGIDVDTVIPARSPRYALAAPKRIPKMIPTTIDLMVNSAVLSCGEI